VILLDFPSSIQLLASHFLMAACANMAPISSLIGANSTLG
jgi:hypothetical protein